MNRMQFMRELSHLLSDISEAEREEALEYYENYFEDAGAEREADSSAQQPFLSLPTKSQFFFYSVSATETFP